MNKLEYQEILAFHPGYYIKDYMDDYQLSQEELAKRLQTTPKYISDLVNGRINLTDEMVFRLSNLFGTSTKLWLNLNQKFIEKKLEIQRRKSLEKESKFLKMLDYSYWCDLGVVELTNDDELKIKELQRFFKLSSLSVLEQDDFLVQYKWNKCNETIENRVNANAWVQTAINLGVDNECQVFDRKKLLNSIEKILSLTSEDLQYVSSDLHDILSECGVSLVLLPELKNSNVKGAIKWLNKEKVVLALVNNLKDKRTFWYSFFHELGHVMQKRIKLLLVSNNVLEFDDSFIIKLEQDADDFAEKMMALVKWCNE
ncbi:MAG: HigA family addiction module antitoxin [Longicatena sp.]|nr:HigA family addiction module antitoxin [Longicatena sp.]